ncbi:hypothetical protein SAY87_015331 [Trapa incisa]|uniref:Protein BZR1 homolog n=1 Tax=Trapa incisa TaxID=236973 RepID=A0AAN7GLI3_9MYRT|nr:hypothetical protein SAY87_015331 [Trapa incisa]
MDPGSDRLIRLPHLQQPQHLQPQQQLRRPRGFAVTAPASAAMDPSSPSGSGAKGKREREKEKERTKLRERHRRAITSRMLAGLRQYGNFPLPARADMNDVLAALAREAGWTVEADGTTHRQFPPPSELVPGYVDLPDVFKMGFVVALMNAAIWGVVRTFWWKFLELY